MGFSVGIVETKSSRLSNGTRQIVRADVEYAFDGAESLTLDAAFYTVQIS
jgi:hypothetical protein